MYLDTGSDYYLISLPNKKVNLKNGIIVTNPSFRIRYLTLSELSKVEHMLEAGFQNTSINEEVFYKVILNLVGYEDHEIDLDNSDAFIFESIVSQIISHSFFLINNKVQAFNHFRNQVTWIEACARIVAFYTHNKSQDVMRWPIDEIIREYAICQAAFPNLLPIEDPPEEVPNKVL